MGLCTFMTPQKMLKTLNLIKIGSLWAWQNLWGYGRKVHAKFWPWGMPWDLIYDHLAPMLPPNVQILIHEIFLTWPYGHLQDLFLVFHYEFVTRNPTMGIPALEDGLFANL